MPLDHANLRRLPHRDLSYSNFIRGLTIAKVELNRKTLSELAIHEPAIFDEIVEIAEKSIPQATPAA